MLTHSGKRFDFDNINPDAICIEDIATSLANQCRFNGHANSFYSVAHHSVIMADAMSQDGYDNKMVRTALLHDASEAYLGDMVKPLKSMMPDYEALESKVMSAIAEKYDIYWPLPDEIKEYDLMMLKAEMGFLMPRYPEDLEYLKGVGDLSLDVQERFDCMGCFIGFGFKRRLQKYDDIQSACDNLAPVDSN